MLYTSRSVAALHAKSPATVLFNPPPIFLSPSPKLPILEHGVGLIPFGG